MDRRFVKTERAIRDAYFSLLEERKEKISVAEIARKADIDRKTFYLHYASADDIILRFAQETLDELLTMLEERGFYSLPYDLTVFFNCLNELMMRDIDLYQNLAKNRNNEFFWETIHKIVYDSIQNLYLKGLDQENTGLQTYIDFYISGIIAIYRRWLEADDRMPLAELNKHMLRISLAAINSFLPPEYLKEHDVLELGNNQKTHD